MVRSSSSVICLVVADTTTDAGDLLPAVQSLEELVQSLKKKSATFVTDGRRLLGDISASVNKKLGGPRR